MTVKQRKMLIRISVSGIWLIQLLIVPMPKIPMLVLYVADYLLIGYDILRKALWGILHGQVFDETFLMSVATLGAFGLAVYEGNYQATEAVAVMLFYQIGELFQNIAIEKSRRSIAALTDIRPDTATLETEDGIRTVSPTSVPVGSLVLIKPGERIPLDGTVESGSSSVNTSALTGESLPQYVKSGDKVLSGCINMTGILHVRTTVLYEQSTVARIMDLLESASSRKAHSETVISKFAHIYTPAVCIGALCLAVLPPLFRLWILDNEPLFSVWIYRALIFLVISCPCALVVSVPLTFFAGLGTAGKNGILIKGSCYMETLSRVKTVIFDKTGTLTQGTFTVCGVHHSPLSEQDVLFFAAAAEYASSHPIAGSLRQAYGQPIDSASVQDVCEFSGEGTTALVNGNRVAVGNGTLMTRFSIPFSPCHEIGTVVHIAVNGQYAGHILIRDNEKTTALEAVVQLKKAGITRTVMLTGDIEPVAKSVSQTLGIDAWHSGLLPADKVAIAESIIQQNQHNGYVAFVGDGINDAPVLTRADVGIAMGALGSDAAVEAADVVLTDDDPLKIVRAIQISRKSVRIVYENIILSLTVKFVCLLLSAAGIADMGVAVFADVGVMVLAVLNALRVMLPVRR